MLRHRRKRAIWSPVVSIQLPRGGIKHKRPQPAEVRFRDWGFALPASWCRERGDEILQAKSCGCPLGRLGRCAAGLRNELAVPLPLPRLLPLRFHLLQPLSGLLHLSLKISHKEYDFQPNSALQMCVACLLILERCIDSNPESFRNC